MLSETKRSSKALISDYRDRSRTRGFIQNQIQKESEGANSDHAKTRDEEADGEESR